MIQNYYKSDYSEKQWYALVDKAEELGCHLSYSKYGNILTVDSTEIETAIMDGIGRSGHSSTDRRVWAEHINSIIDNAAKRY